MSLGGCRKQGAWQQRWCCAVDCSKVSCRKPGRHGRPWSPAALIGQSVQLTTTSGDTGDWCQRRDVCCQLSNVAPDRGDNGNKDGEFEVDTFSGPQPEAPIEEVWRAGTDLSGRLVWRRRWASPTVVGGDDAQAVRRAWHYCSVDVSRSTSTTVCFGVRRDPSWVHFCSFYTQPTWTTSSRLMVFTLICTPTIHRSRAPGAPVLSTYSSPLSQTALTRFLTGCARIGYS